MQNIAHKAFGEAAQSGGALARGFAALGYRKCLLIMLASAVLSVLLAVGLWYLLRWAVGVDIAHSEHFRPGRPQPTHRMALP